MLQCAQRMRGEASLYMMYISFQVECEEACLIKQHCHTPTYAEPQRPPVLQQGATVSTRGRQAVRWDSERQGAQWQTDGSPSMAEISSRRWLLSSSSSILVMTLPLPSRSFATRRWCSAWAATCTQQTHKVFTARFTESTQRWHPGWHLLQVQRGGGSQLYQHMKSLATSRQYSAQRHRGWMASLFMGTLQDVSLPFCPSPGEGVTRTESGRWVPRPRPGAAPFCGACGQLVPPAGLPPLSPARPES